MRLIQRLQGRRRHPDRPPRVSISQAEITADLLYPASRRQADVPAERRPGS